MASIEQNKKKEHLENFLKELGIKRPLRVSELNKDDIRTLSKDLELPTWNKQSFACLSSRFVYGETISEEKLKMVDKAEQLLLDMGFYPFTARRLRPLRWEMNCVYTYLIEHPNQMNGLYHASCILHRVYFLYPFFERMIFMGTVGTRKRGKTSQYYFQLVSVDGTFTVYDILMQQFFMRRVFQVHIFILCVRDVYIGLFQEVHKKTKKGLPHKMEVLKPA